jgi:hypothetical protein
MNNLKIEFKWAVVFSVVGLIWMALEKTTGLHSTNIDYHIYLTNLFAIPAIWVMILALRDKRNNFYNGNITYIEGFISGFFLSLFIASISPLTQYITSYIISPEYFPNVIKRSVEIGYYATKQEAEANFNYPNYALKGAIGSLVMGIVTSSIVMLFFKTKK